MNPILFISGHPELAHSVANKAILELLAPYDFQYRHLAQLYPHYQIDVPTEQQQLINADVVVFQFPLYWSTYPAIMKQWFDQTFTYNFAFGPEGDKLKDKKVILSITAGATEDSYHPDGFNFFALEEYLKAAMHPVYAAQMNIVDTIVTFEMNATEAEGGDKNKVAQLAQAHTQRLLAAIAAHSSQ